MTKQIILLFFYIPLILSESNYNIQVNTDADCSEDKNRTTFSGNSVNLVKISSTVAYGQEPCSIYLVNSWHPEYEDGLAVFPTRSMDCGSSVSVECVPDTVLDDRSTPKPIELTCQSRIETSVMPCREIRLTYKRDINVNEPKKATYIQVVSLAKGPCMDNDVFFSCSRDYPRSCIDANLQCNGRTDCLNGEDEQNCPAPTSSGIPLYVIILIVLAFVILFCILSIALICWCCRTAINGVVRRFRSTKKDQKTKKENVVATGEDARLMEGLTGVPTVIEIPAQRNMEPAPLVIDSTKPIYPRLE